MATTEIPSVVDAISAVQKFLEPAIRTRDSSESITEKIAAAKFSNSTSLPNDEERRSVIREACHLLMTIHKAVVKEQDRPSGKPAYDSSLLSAVYNLLDLLILDGVYPALPAGVGSPVERRAKSLLYDKPDPAYVPPQNLGVIELVLKETLNSIVAEYDIGIEPMQRHHILTDMIAGNACLAHSGEIKQLNGSWNAYLERLPPATLYRSFTTVMKPSAPGWFQSVISSHLSLLPLRKDGVRHTIDFIAYSYPTQGSATQADKPNPSQGPGLPTEALQQAAKLLSSVPKSMSPESYFSQLAPQLLSLLDGAEGSEISRVAAFIISSGILGKRSFGAPGTIGWKLFAEPLLKTFDPPASKPARKRKAGADSMLLAKELVSQESLVRTISRLYALIESHPNPSLTGRLVKPIILPLWALMNYEKHSSSPEISTIASQILGLFFRLSGSAAHLAILTENLLWDGAADWDYGPSGQGAIAIRERDRTSQETFNIIEAIPRIDIRVSSFLQLLGLVDGSIIATIFLNLSKQWLLPPDQSVTTALQVEVDPLAKLAQAKLVQGILERFQDTISKQPDQLLALIAQILQQHYVTLENEKKRKEELIKPTYSSLSNIVRHEPQNTSEISNFGSSNDSEEMLSVAVSLLNTILASSELNTGPETTTRMKSIENVLVELLKLPDNNVSVAVKLSIQSALSLLKSTNSASSVTNSEQISMEATAQQVQQTLSDIANDLGSDLPPLRNSALHALHALIKTVDIQIDVPTVALLLLNIIRNDPEEFVYLAAIRTLTELALRRDLGFVSKLTAEAFQDNKEQADVDGRLRVGEALYSLVEVMGSGNVGFDMNKRRKVVCGIADLATSVAGRRGTRRKEAQEKQQRDRLEKRKKREAERAWGGEVPVLPDDEELDQDPVTREKQRKELEAVEKIVKGWEDTGFEEDIRIRTSALSILSQAFEHCLDLCSTSNVDSAADMALSILSLELGVEKAILRRAAVLVLLAVLKGMDNAHESGKESASGLAATKWMDLEKVLAWVASTDDDDLVTGHAQTVLESLEAWRMKRLFSATTPGLTNGLPDMDLEGRLQGLEVNPIVADRNSGRPKIEEIE